MRVHAWVPSSCFSDPEKTVAELLAAGVSVANIMVNPMPEDYGSSPFVTHNIDKIKAMAAAWRKHGREVHFTSWAKPHREYMQGALEVLPGLMQSTGATMLWWDAEEPWVHATGSFDYAEAAEYAARCFPRLALSGIGSAPVELCDLAKVCRVHSFQGYADDDGDGATPGGVVPYSLTCWQDQYSVPAEGYIVGLAGYDQGTPPASTMQPPIDDVLAAGISDVCYWTINAIADRSDVTTFVAGLSTPVTQPPATSSTGRIFPTLVIPSMPKGVVSKQLMAVQALLRDVWGVDPGPVDGLPGTKTENGVKTFQSSLGMPATGVVDGNTWVELLSERA
jgi:hypothetical protein